MIDLILKEEEEEEEETFISNSFMYRVYVVVVYLSSKSTL